jgi:hypothetical protein
LPKSTIVGYKFVQDNLASAHGNHTWKLGEWAKAEGQLVMCKKGFHASRDPLDSLNYVFENCNRWFMVEAKGEIIEDDDKFVAGEMRLTREISDPKLIFVEFAIVCAKRVLPNFEKSFPDDKRPRAAIEAAEAWLKEPTEENMKKAEKTAEAAWSAESAARSAESAARSAWSAARSAESAARSAWSAEEKWQRRQLKTIINRHLKHKGA